VSDDRERAAQDLEAALETLARTESADVWERLAAWRAAGRRFVLASVVHARGFTPRKPGAHMLIAEDGATMGTIGGGAIEELVLVEARGLLAEGGAKLVQKHLTTELGMCCGGEMAVYLEVLEPAPRLLLFGAGYIGKAVSAMATACGFQVTVVDDRPEWLQDDRFPGASVRLEDPESFLRREPPAPHDSVVVVTHDHAIDQRLVELLMPHPVRFLGMVGSLPKQRKFALRLKARGHAPEQIARLRSPLGLAIGAATPEEIALSIVAELVQVRRGAVATRTEREAAAARAAGRGREDAEAEAATPEPDAPGPPTLEERAPHARGKEESRPTRRRSGPRGHSRPRRRP
jgi:xanthine dehydrogenase accessory factor